MKYSNVQKRIFAKFIDLLIVLCLGLLWKGGVGSVVGFFYSIAADALPFKNFEGQSFGKKMMRIQVVPESHHGYLKTSLLRNAPVGVVTFLMIIPFWGWILSALVGIPLGLIEISLMVRADRRQRLGDVMAESVVVDTASLKKRRGVDHDVDHKGDHKVDHEVLIEHEPKV